MNEQVKARIGSALRAAAAGQWQQAERDWRQVLELEPGHPQALFSLGVHARQRGQTQQALALLQAARQSAPGDPSILMANALVLRDLGDVQAERDALDAALAVDPYLLPALLGKADWFERRGQPKLAMAQYRNALKVAPPQAQWPLGLRAQLERGRALVQRYGDALTTWLADQSGTRMQALTPAERGRWEEAGAILAGQSQPYPSICHQLQVPRLPAIPFFERADFPWVAELESRTDAIRAELQAALATQSEAFQPYVAYAPGVPLNQWQELNHSRRWSGYLLWDNGRPVQEHLQRCPITADTLALVQQPDIDGMCPNAMFSALAPHTHIPPHTGETNARLVVHLPLIVPEGCMYRVGFERRPWKVGEVFIFDDSIEHEARNDSDELRVILMFDIWNPLLSEGEREMVRFLTRATREFEFAG